MVSGLKLILSLIYLPCVDVLPPLGVRRQHAHLEPLGQVVEHGEQDGEREEVFLPPEKNTVQRFFLEFPSISF